MAKYLIHGFDESSVSSLSHPLYAAILAQFKKVEVANASYPQIFEEGHECYNVDDLHLLLYIAVRSSSCYYIYSFEIQFLLSLLFMLYTKYFLLTRISMRNMASLPLAVTTRNLRWKFSKIEAMHAWHTRSSNFHC
jgi:hypothetical protein